MAQSVLSNGNPVGGFFRWWFDELASLIPMRLSRTFRRQGGRMEFNCSETGASLVFKTDGKEHVLGDFDFAEGSSGVQQKAIAALSPKIHHENVVTVLRLPKQQALRKTIRLPLEAAENLREVLGFEMDRHTPFKPDDVYYDGRITEMDEASRQIVVEITAVPRTVVDGLLEKISAWGFQPERVGIIEIENPSSRRPLNLLLKQDGRKSGGIIAKLSFVLMVIAIALAVALVSLPLQHRQQLLDDLSQQSEVARKSANEAGKLQQEINEILSRSRYLADKSKTYTPLSVALNELARLVPDDSWLSYVRYKGGKLTVSGFSKSAADLIGILEKGDLFSGVKFTAPLVRDPRLGAERFTLQLDLVAGERP